MTADEVVEIPVFEVKQPYGTFYIGVMKAKDLTEMAYSDLIRLTDLAVPKYEGYQRALDLRRVVQIRKYLTDSMGAFPGSIILNVNSAKVIDWPTATLTTKSNAPTTTPNLQNVVTPTPVPPAHPEPTPTVGVDPRPAALQRPTTSILRLRREQDSLAVIDGQHRAAALDARPDMDVIVTIFVDLEMVQCAEVFRVVNSTQKKINPSISYQLFGYSEKPSPQKTAHEVARTVNETEGSPFYRRLKMLGMKMDELEKGVLSQATFARELIKLYSRKPIDDEYDFLAGRRLKPDATLPLRQHLIEQDKEGIVRVLWTFFAGVARTWGPQWTSPGSILWRSTGYVALMQVLRDWLLSPHRDELDSIDQTVARFALATTVIQNPAQFFDASDFAGSGYKEASALAKTLKQALGLA